MKIQNRSVSQYAILAATSLMFVLAIVAVYMISRGAGEWVGTH